MRYIGGTGLAGLALAWLVPHALPFFAAGLIIGAAFAWLGRGYHERRLWERFNTHALATKTLREAEVVPFARYGREGA